MVSGKFAITTHVLVLLAKFKNEYISSEFIAGSINIHPVLVRKEIINLKKHKVVEGKEGKNGGVKLIKKPAEITMKDVFEMTIKKASLGYSKNTPNPECPVGKTINSELDNMYSQINNKVLNHLEKISLKDFTNQF